MAGSSGEAEPTFYETLGVDEDASVAELRAAYRERAKSTHPDVSDAPDAGRRFRRVKRAHEVLTDERERRRYDRLGHEAYVAGERRPSTDEGASDAAGGATDDRTAERRPHGETDPAGGHGGGTAGGRPGGGAGHGADARGRSRRGAGAGTPAEQGPIGRVAYRLARWLTVAVALADAWHARLGPAAAATALATFAAYPVLLASTVTPLFPVAVNLLVGICLLGVLAYLVLRPAVGVAVLGAWLLLLPVALTVTGIGVVSLGGLYAVVLTGVPLVLCVATLLGGAA